MLPWFLLGCVPSAPEVAPADLVAIQAALAFPEPRVPLQVQAEAPERVGSVTATAVSIEVYRDFEASAVLLRPERPTHAGVLVAHGHYGEGKSSAEAREIGWRLARSGALVLLVDSPGVEEWEIPARALHLEEGAHNRAWLLAGGTHAMALQVGILEAGLDLLVAEGATHLAATGASGGGVQAFWLGMADPRVEAVILASFPPIPREPRAGGCACDQVPGFPGPDPAVLSALPIPSLWLSELQQPRPPGLGSAATMRILVGPHSYSAQMQEAAWAWLDRHLDLRSPTELELPTPTPRTPGPAAPGIHRGIRDLALHPTTMWQPMPWEGVPYSADCAGEGPTVVVGGAGPGDLRALRAAGLRACVVRVPADETGFVAAVGEGRVMADRQLGALATVAAREGAVGAYGVRAWGLVASGLGLPFVWRDPLTEIEDLDPSRDPEWVHVPGAWWGVCRDRSALALETGEEAKALALRLAEGIAGSAAGASPAGGMIEPGLR